jgi:hypothetical protein
VKRFWKKWNSSVFVMLAVASAVFLIVSDWGSYGISGGQQQAAPLLGYVAVLGALMYRRIPGHLELRLKVATRINQVVTVVCVIIIWYWIFLPVPAFMLAACLSRRPSKRQRKSGRLRLIITKVPTINDPSL